MNSRARRVERRTQHRVSMRDFYGEDQVSSIRRDLPKPPPSGVEADPVKWQRMTRPERRAAIRQQKAAEGGS